MEIANNGSTTAGRSALQDMRMDSTVSASTLKAWNSSGYSSLDFYSGWYPHYNFTLSRTRSTFDEAFGVVSMMIEKGYLRNVTLKKFIKIVKEVADEL